MGAGPRVPRAPPPPAAAARAAAAAGGCAGPRGGQRPPHVAVGAWGCAARAANPCKRPLSARLTKSSLPRPAVGCRPAARANTTLRPSRCTDSQIRLGPPAESTRRGAHSCCSAASGLALRGAESWGGLHARAGAGRTISALPRRCAGGSGRRSRREHVALHARPRRAGLQRKGGGHSPTAVFETLLGAEAAHGLINLLVGWRSAPRAPPPLPPPIPWAAHPLCCSGLLCREEHD